MTSTESSPLALPPVAVRVFPHADVVAVADRWFAVEDALSCAVLGGGLVLWRSRGVRGAHWAVHVVDAGLALDAVVAALAVERAVTIERDSA